MKDKDICEEVGLNYHLYRYYLTNINKELRVLLTQVRTKRKEYKHEQDIRKTRSKLKSNPIDMLWHEYPITLVNWECIYIEGFIAL